MTETRIRGVQALFVVSAALFICGIGFIVVAARTRIARSPAVAAPPASSVASIKQIMNAIVMPNATVIYDAVGTTLTAAGTVEVFPKTDKEWDTVGASAAAIVESGQLMLRRDRALDDGAWITMTQKFIDQGKRALVAANAKKKDDVFEAGGDLNVTCDVCHEKYQRQ